MPLWCLQIAASNWEAGRLSPEQIKYAARDAFLPWYTYARLQEWRAGPGPPPACPQCSRALGTVGAEHALSRSPA